VKVVKNLPAYNKQAQYEKEILLKIKEAGFINIFGFLLLMFVGFPMKQTITWFIWRKILYGMVITVLLLKF
jgi:hypothetical protein